MGYKNVSGNSIIYRYLVVCPRWDTRLRENKTCPISTMAGPLPHINRTFVTYIPPSRHESMLGRHRLTPAAKAPMTVFLRLRLLLVLSLLLPTGLPVFAQGVGTMYGNSGFSDATTSKLSRSLTQGIATCRESLEAVYRYDCYRQTYADAVKDLKYSRDYAPAQAILAEVEQSLGRTIARHADPSAPVVRQGFTRFRAIRAAIHHVL